jgi:hypothetical protein
MSAPNKLLDMIAQRRASVSRAKTIKPESGRNRYRILPSWRKGEDGKLDPQAQFWLDYAQHFVKGPDKAIKAIFVCADKTFGQPCEVCDAIAKGVAAAEDDLTIELLTEAKSSPKVLLNVLWLDNGGKCDPNIPQILEVPPSVFNGKKGVGGVISLFNEWPNLINLHDGIDIIVEKSGTGREGTSYGVQIAGGSKPVNPAVLEKINDLDKFAASESEDTMRRALTSLASLSGVPVARLASPSRPALTHDVPTPASASVAARLDAAQEAGLRAIEGTATVVSSTPASAAAAPAPATVTAPAPAPAAPVAGAVEPTGDAELDALLSSI